MASSEASRDTPTDLEPATPFVRRARVAALTFPALLLVAGLPGTRFAGDGSAGELGDLLLSAVALATALPTLPLFASLPIGSSAVVLALGAATSLPVWVWGGGRLARRVEAGHGPDWRRWGVRYLGFPVVGVFLAALFIGGLTPMS